jgi:opacity protein-like surface antigen
MSKSVHGAALVILALLVVDVSADDFKGYYAGVGIGSAPITTPGADHEHGTGFKVFTGYSFGEAISDNELLALELAYIDGGSVGNSFVYSNNLAGTQRSIFRSEVETQVASFSLLGTLPVTDWFGVFAKAGYAYIDLDTTFTNQALGARALQSLVKVNNVQHDLTYGGGLAFCVGKSFQARAEYETFDVDDTHLDFISLSAIFRFR